MTEQVRTGAPEDARPVYSISVAAELAELAVPTLRLYEERGLVTPARTGGGSRRYSADDVERIRRVSGLVEDGVTLAAVQMVLDLQDSNRSLTDANRALRDRNAALRKDNARLRADD